MRVSLAVVFALVVLIHGDVGLELQQSTLGQTFEESSSTNGNNSLCDHSTLDHFAGPEVPSGCPATAFSLSAEDEHRQFAETTPTPDLSSIGAFVPEKFPSKMVSLMVAQNETLLLDEDCGGQTHNISMFTSQKFEEDFVDLQDQVAFYLTVFYLAALMGASFFAFYCICRFRRNTTNAPDHHV